MAKKIQIIWLLLIVAFVFFRTQINFPFTVDETKESYTAYSLIKTGRDTNGMFFPLLFRSDNNYLSSLGVYFRLPSILTFGLTDLGIRLPGLILGVLTLGIFYLVVKGLLKEKSKAFLSVFLLALSPFFIAANIFELGQTSALFFSLLSFYFLVIKNRVNPFLLTAILAILSSFSALPVIVTLVVFNFLYPSKDKRELLKIAITFLIFAGFIFSQNQFIEFIKRSTIFQNILPDSYTYLIDRRLSFGSNYGSPLITADFNFNRIAHNKPFYATKSFFEWIIMPFNYERLAAPSQSQTVLANDEISPRYLPKFFFWEIPVVILGLLLLFKRRNKNLNILLASGLAATLTFKDSLIFLLPLIIIAETAGITYFMGNLTKTWAKITVGIISLLVIFSLASFVDLFRRHYDMWFNEEDFRQYQIWSTITDEDLRSNKIVVTDRLGEPIFYYLLYEKVDPEFFNSNKVYGVLTDEDIRRIERVGSVEFKSFKYFESPRGPNEIWAGMGGEFVGENMNFEKIDKVFDGEIVKKIKGVKQENKFLGEEFWFVRTTL